MEQGEFEVLAPSEIVRPFVRRYLYASRALDKPYVMRPKPTGYVYFSNCFDLPFAPDAWRVVVDGEVAVRHSRWNFAGQIVDHDIAVEVLGRLSAVFCELAATAPHRLFGIPAAKITGRAVALSIAGAQFDELARMCFQSGPENSRDGHLVECERFFVRVAETARPGDPAIERAVELFETANGAARVADICIEVGMGQRQFARRFGEIVGVSPKFFGQILQINWVVGALFSRDAETLTEIAHGAGFYDQAHFNHAMQRFFSQGPSEFLASDHVAFKAFLGASRDFGPGSAAPR